MTWAFPHRTLAERQQNALLLFLKYSTSEGLTTETDFYVQESHQPINLGRIEKIACESCAAISFLKIRVMGWTVVWWSMSVTNFCRTPGASVCRPHQCNPILCFCSPQFWLKWAVVKRVSKLRTEFVSR